MKLRKNVAAKYGLPEGQIEIDPYEFGYTLGQADANYRPQRWPGMWDDDEDFRKSIFDYMELAEDGWPSGTTATQG